MACNSNAIILPVTPGYDGYLINPLNNAFVTMWSDKRSTSYSSISISVSGSTCLDGYLSVQTSNAPENSFRSTFGSGPQLGVGLTMPADTIVVPSMTQLASTTLGPAGTYTNRFEFAGLISARWFRIVYTPTTNVTSPLIVYAWVNSPFLSA